MCVEHLNRCKTSTLVFSEIKQGATGVPGAPVANEDTHPGTRVNVPACSGPGRQPLKWGP